MIVLFGLNCMEGDYEGIECVYLWGGGIVNLLYWLDGEGYVIFFI